MAAFVVNGTPVTVEKNQKLIRYLREYVLYPNKLGFSMTKLLTFRPFLIKIYQFHQ